MASASYQLEHFYYGRFVRQGQPEGDPRLLAYSAGIKQELAEELVTEAALPPLPGVPGGAWAIVRSSIVPFVMVQAAQQGAGGQSMWHYVTMQSDVLRALGGNLDVLKQLFEAEMPVYDRLGDRLPPLFLPQAGPPPAHEQIDHILELMTCTRNRTDVIELLLSAVVEGVQIVVLEAPAELESRLNFVKGLLALLPPPARFGVTFATHSESDTRLDAQIRFFSGDEPPADTLLFHWPTARVSGRQVEDGYSHFMVSQLRLDAGLVIQETQALTPIAAWRIKRGDALAAALAYASHRKALDRALRHNQPVEIDDVSGVLAHDRTLDDDLRRTYANHLLSISLALDDMQYADPLAVLMRQDRELETTTHQKLEAALNEGKAELVYATLTRWLGNPMGPQGRLWVQLAHQAILTRMDQLAQRGDLTEVNTFLIDIQQADPGVEVGHVVPRLVEMALPFSLRYKPLAETIFLLAINYLESGVIMRLLEAPRYVTQLPPAVARVVPYLDQREPDLAPAGLLMEVSNAFGAQWQPLVLLRLTEAGVAADRLDLLDTSALSGLANVAKTHWGVQYADLLRSIVKSLSTDEMLPTLDEPLYLLQNLLLLGDFSTLAQEMLHQSRTLYPGDAQVDYALMVQRLFAETPLPAPQALDALQSIEAGGIRSVPLMMAQIGVIQGQADSDAVEPLAERVIESLFKNPGMLSVMQARPMHDLLRFYVKRQDVPGAVRVASLFPEVAAHHSNQGIVMMVRMYKALYRDAELQVAGLELLRRYVRQSDTTSARRAITHFGRELGLKVREALEATYKIKRLMNDVGFDDYATFLHTTAELLDSTARAYVDKNNLPTLGALVNTVQSLSGGLMDDESNAIAAAVIGVGQTVAALGDDYHTRAPRELDKHIEDLLSSSEEPRSALDVLWVMGGYFARGRRYRVRFQLAPHPLGERSSKMLHEDAEISHQVLRGLLQAFPPDKPINVTSEAICGEVESLWSTLDEAMRRDRVRDLAVDLQRTVQLIEYIAENGDARAVHPSSPLGRKLDEGKTQPKSTLEFYRYVHGYFHIT
ncbi:MAG: hypothetical protein K8J31_09855 [Anaerolineae bacterium]|nr:hypothetical protein [Anaerolineae bacterium]